MSIISNPVTKQLKLALERDAAMNPVKLDTAMLLNCHKQVLDHVM